MTVTLTVPDTSYSDIPNDVLAPFDPRLFLSAAVISGANRTVTCRVMAKRSGFLRDVITAFGVSSGNYDIGIYDTGETTAAVRTLLGHLGATAVPTAETGAAKTTVKWDPGAGVIPIVAGRQYDLAVSLDNTTATIYRYAATQPSFLPDSYWAVAGGSAQALPKLNCVVTTAHPLLATVAEAAMLIQGFVPWIMGRISPT